MNQFKDVFLETGTRPYARAADTQKVLRVSGKHNDLEEVGLDTYHHTFFEMLGNWSFGDYFKKEAIAWAWELLVDIWGLDPTRMYATVHGGDEGFQLEADVEAADLWSSETTIPKEQILYFGSKDNFWMMGDTGPCGPCSEIHYDMRSDAERAAVSGASLVNADDPRVIEIWNLVFIQYDAQSDGTLRPLSAKHVDTGMGFERMVAVMQGKASNYDTDLFAPILSQIAHLSPRPDVRGYDDVDLAEPERERVRIAMRVIADHARTVSFAIADGVLPGNAGRGYVIRRILRRAIRFGYQTLGFKTPFMFQLTDAVIEKMGAVFPELSKNRDYIQRVIRSEEESFLETLGTGIEFFDHIAPLVQAATNQGQDAFRKTVESDSLTLDLLQKSWEHQEVDDQAADVIDASWRGGISSGQIPGEVAFLFHDTYGFPIDLTQLMAKEAGIGVNMDRYAALMNLQRERARSASRFSRATSDGEWTTITPDTPDSEFHGYDVEELTDCRIVSVRTIADGDGQQSADVILSKTPFYAESGGQVGDTGVLLVDGEQLRVLDTFKEDGRIVHRVSNLPANLEASVVARVDSDRRAEIEKHHSVTHLMHSALRDVLGDHVAQKGSLVAPDRIRFDFGHYEKVSDEQLQAVAKQVNAMIQRNIPREEERAVPIQDALSRGATALFGEKYGEVVRVITFDPDYSVELCGGTHVDASGEIGLFLFTGESSVAAGVRRVEAVAGHAALEYVAGRLQELADVESQFRTLQGPVSSEVANLVAEKKNIAKELEAATLKLHSADIDSLLGAVKEVQSVRLLAHRMGATTMDTLRGLGQDLRGKLGDNSVGILGTVDPEGDKVYIVATVSDDLTAKGIKAGALVSALAKIVGGGGGGRPELATAGGKDPSKLDEALRESSVVLGQMLS